MKKISCRVLSLVLVALLLLGSVLLSASAQDLPDDHPDVRLVNDEAGFLAALNEEYENRVIRLTANIALSDWVPFNLNSSDTAAKKTFILEGKGNVITMQVNQSNAQYAGLFGNADSVNITIKELGIINQGIRVSGESNTYAGGFFGFAKNSTITIEQSFVSGDSIVADRSKADASGTSAAGGFVGLSEGTTLSINDSFAITEVESLIVNEDWNFQNLESYAGGLVGGQTGGSAKINRCYFVGAIHSHASGSSLTTVHRHAGGIIGEGNASVTNTVRTVDAKFTGNFVSDILTPFSSEKENDAGTKLTEANLRKKTAPSNQWDFTTIWEYRNDPRENDGFPVLQAFPIGTFEDNGRVDALFSKPSTTYNHRLANFAFELAVGMYNPITPLLNVIPPKLAGPIYNYFGNGNPSIEQAFADNDFIEPEYYPDEIKPSYEIKYEEIVRAIAHRKILDSDGKSRDLVAVVVRGAISLDDWAGCINVFTNDANQHKGFAGAAAAVLKSFRDYLSEYSLDNPIVLVTGHSMGAAASNLVAEHLNKHAFNCEDTTCKGCKNNENNVYSYTFAGPQVQRDITTNETNNRNIFNILNRNDVVTHLVALTTLWPILPGWERHGITIPITMEPARLDVTQHLGPYTVYIPDLPASTTLPQMMAISNSKLSPKLFGLKCPVDVTLYDEEGNVIAQVIDDIATNIEGSAVFAWVTEDGEKNFFLPYGMDISHAEVVARDNGNMKVLMASLGDPGELEEVKTFEGIILEEGREYYIDLSEDIAVDDARLMVTENNAIIGEVSTDGVTTVPVKGISIVGDHQRTLTVGQTTLVTCDYIPTLPTNRTIIWDSSNEAVATVDIDGVVTAHSVGGAIITGTSQDGGYKAQCIITVEPETEISINGDPAIILNLGQQHQLTADVTVNSVSRPITWSSSNESITVVSADGLVTAIALGNAIITATTKDGKKASVVVTVENETAITIKGDAARLLTLGQQHQLIAEVTNNSTALPITWSSSNEAVAPVTASGIVTASAVGSATITATTKDGYVAQVLITVEAKTGITIVGDPARILTQGQQHQLTADVTSNSTSLPLTWTSSNEAVATVTAGGLVTAQSVGSAIITATTKDGYAAQVLVTVEAATTISISGDASRLLKQGQQQQLTANVANNSVALPLAWSSSNDAVASVSASGLVTALTSGSAVITVTTNDGYIAQVIFTVEGQTEISIPGEATRLLSVGQQQQLTATVTQNSTSLPIAWTSSNEAVAPISSNGLITALSVGSAVITATTNDGYKAQVLVTVEAKTTITIAGAANQIATLGKPLQLITTVTQNSTSLPITWKSSNEAVAKVSADGLVTPQAIGTAMITATTKDGVSAQVMITVEAQTEISIAGAATRILTLGLSEQLFATATQNSSALPITWNSSNPAVATVNENGIVTAQAIGSAMITATTKDGYTAQVMFTVESPTTLSISGIPAGKLEVGKPHQLTANVPHNSTALPIAWTSSNEAVATVSDTGLITPKSPGNTIITATTSDGQSEQIIVTVVKAQSTFMRWLTTFFGWLITPFRWLWNAIVSMFTAIGKFFGMN